LQRREEAHQVQVVITRTASAVAIQSMIRSWKSRRVCLQRLEQNRHIKDEREAIAATTIQTMARSWRCQSELSKRIIIAQEFDLKRKLIAVTKIQAVARSCNCRREQSAKRDLLKRITAATTIQASYRSRELCQRKSRACELERERRATAATTIQAMTRSWMCRRELLQRREEAHQVQVVITRTASAVAIQSMIRSWKSRRVCLQRLEQNRHIKDEREAIAATTIQTMARSWRCQKELSRKMQNIQTSENVSVVIRDQKTPPAIGNCWPAPALTGMDLGTASSIAVNANLETALLIGREDILKSQVLKSSVMLIQGRLRGILVRNQLRCAINATVVIQRAWRQCVFSLRMKLLQVFELLSCSDPTRGVSLLPSPMKKAKAFLPRDARRLNRIKGITPHLPRYHECGVFVEEILNSVTVLIQSTVRRFLARQNLLKLHQAASIIQCAGSEAVQERVLRAVTDSSSAFHKVGNRKDEVAQVEEQKYISLRFSTDDENELFILSHIYQQAQANADAVYVLSLPVPTHTKNLSIPS